MNLRIYRAANFQTGNVYIIADTLLEAINIFVSEFNDHPSDIEDLCSNDELLILPDNLIGK